MAEGVIVVEPFTSRAKHRAYMRQYDATHKERKKLRAAYVAGKYMNKHHRKLRDRLRALATRHLRRHLRGGKVGDNTATRAFGCTMAELVARLEQQFKPGMTWENYGSKADHWFIGHIWPMAWFDLREKQAVKQVTHYTNLQPLWYRDDIRRQAS